jgi:hypothetical protein
MLAGLSSGNFFLRVQSLRQQTIRFEWLNLHLFLGNISSFLRSTFACGGGKGIVASGWLVRYTRICSP